MIGSFHPGIELTCKSFEGKAGEEPPLKVNMQLEHSDFQKRNLLLEGSIFKFHVGFRGCKHKIAAGPD